MSKIKVEKKSILVTRPRHQAENFLNVMEQYGMEGISFPAIDIAEKILDAAEIEVLNNLEQYNIAIFISSNAVDYAMKVLKSNNVVFPDNLLVATVGPTTKQKLLDNNVSVDITPDYDYSSEGLLACPEMQGLEDERIIIFRGEGGREILARKLQQRGAEVEYLDCYTRVVPDVDVSDVEKKFRNNEIAAVTITSVSSVNNLMAMLKNVHEELTKVLFVAASNRIADECEKHGCLRVEVAENSGDKAMLRILTMALDNSTASSSSDSNKDKDKDKESQDD